MSCKNRGLIGLYSWLVSSDYRGSFLGFVLHLLHWNKLLNVIDLLLLNLLVNDELVHQRYVSTLFCCRSGQRWWKCHIKWWRLYISHTINITHLSMRNRFGVIMIYFLFFSVIILFSLCFTHLWRAFILFIRSFFGLTTWRTRLIFNLFQLLLF